MSARYNSGSALQLSVLDLSPVPPGGLFRDALQNTLNLAKIADRLGYTRYWLAEHHLPDSASLAPEVMIGPVADVTKRIRVGSGGVMLSHYAPFKVAETFGILGALHPGRIDLGIGRATGTIPPTALALRESRPAPNAAELDTKIEDLLSFLRGGFTIGHPFEGVNALPGGLEAPLVWLLGKSSGSARFAARHGIGFAYAHHFNPDELAEAMSIYREQFRPSAHLAEPQGIIAMSVACAETDDQADRIAHEFDLAHFEPDSDKLFPNQPTPEEIVATNRRTMIIGAPVAVRDRILQVAASARVTEVIVATQTLRHADRSASYELLAEAFALNAQ